PTDETATVQRHDHPVDVRAVRDQPHRRHTVRGHLHVVQATRLSRHVAPLIILAHVPNSPTGVHLPYRIHTDTDRGRTRKESRRTLVSHWCPLHGTYTFPTYGDHRD